MVIPIINKKQYKIPNSPANASHHGSLVSAHHADEPNINTINAITPNDVQQLNQILQHSKSQIDTILVWYDDTEDWLFAWGSEMAR